jgi:hypothetical protein
MGVHVIVTFRCGGCPATATAPEQRISRKFVSLSGYGIGRYVTDRVEIDQVAPEGWMAFDPWTQITYCKNCWASICAATGDAEVRE